MKVINSKYRLLILILFLDFSFTSFLEAQAVPGKDEYSISVALVNLERRHGDNDFYQIFFFSILKDYTKPFYIRVFDPDCGGANDEIQGDFNSKYLFSVYGGKGVDPDKNEDSKGLEKGVMYKTGNLIASKVFGSEARYDNKYYTFGPFNPSEGDFNERWNSYIFKIVCEGVSGDDGNLTDFSEPTE
jgi:hypothetical protein